MSGLIVDNFAGGGGASTGIEWALGVSPDHAINHDAQALALHAANHPATVHHCESVWRVDPRELCRGRRVDLAWFSPDCTHFSKAKGGKPRSTGVRGLAWVVTRWAKVVRPRVIILENVEEFRSWGPLLVDGRPCPDRKGQTFAAWARKLERYGYRVEWRELRACDFGAPTIRKRLFVIARCDGRPIVWPEPTHGPGRPLPYRTAAECIDWSIPAPSIFERSRPLAEATLRRIARGVMRFCVEAPDPFVVHTSHGTASPSLVQTSYGERKGQAPRALDIHQPLGTVVAGGVKHALVQAFLAQHYGEREGGFNGGRALTVPFGSVTTRDHHALVTSHITKFYGTARDGAPVTEPLPTVTANGRGGGHLAEVRAFLLKYYGQGTGQRIDEPAGTVTTKDRFGLVTVAGVAYQIVDIGMRMLTPRELFRAQGFPESYRIDAEVDGRQLSKTAQVRLVGNSVCPAVASALVRANVMAVRHTQVEMRWRDEAATC